MFHRSQYNDIADTISRIKPNYDMYHSIEITAESRMRTRIINELSAMFKQDNDRFNEELFKERCNRD